MQAPFRLKPWYIGIFTSGRWVTTYPWINLPKNTNPDDFPWVVAHETVHLKQQKAMGFWKWLFKYYAHKSFRLDQEAAGAAAEYWALIANSRIPGQAWIEEYAKEYASISYLWCAGSVEEGLVVLQSKIAEAKNATV